MKTKKIIIIISLIILSIIIVSTSVYMIFLQMTEPNFENVISLLSEAISEVKVFNINGLEEILNKNLNISLAELPTYDFEYLSHQVGLRGRILESASSSIINLRAFNRSKYKVNYIKKIDDDCIAVVYKIADKNYSEAYMLVIFKRTIYEGEENFETWKKTGEAYFLNEVHTIEDFATIKVGDSVDVLCEIDKSIHYDILRLESSNNNSETTDKSDDSRDKHSTQKKSPLMVYKLLKDGIMTVEYSYDEMIITEKKYYPYEDGVFPKNVFFTSPINLDFLSNNGM